MSTSDEMRPESGNEIRVLIKNKLKEVAGSERVYTPEYYRARLLDALTLIESLEKERRGGGQFYRPEMGLFRR